MARRQPGMVSRSIVMPASDQAAAGGASSIHSAGRLAKARAMPTWMHGAALHPTGQEIFSVRVSGAKVMKIKVVVHEAEEGGFWAEVPAIPGCASQGETMDELLRNLKEAIEGCLSVDVAEPKPGGKERILEIAV